MNIISKALVGTAAAGAMAMSSAAPASARDRDYDRGGVSAGEIIAGAVILGGIAAVISSSNNRDRYDDRRYNDRRYNDRRGYRNNRGTGRRAVERCVRAAQRDARRAGFRRADVTQIRDVDQTRYGWRVKGRIQVQEGRGGGRYDQRARYNRNDRYNRNNRRGYRANFDKGRFSCDISRGRVVDLDYSGIRGLR